MVHQRMRCKKLQRVFYCNLSKKVQSGAPEKAATNVAAFLLHHSLRDGFMLRLRLAFARGDWSLKMAAGLWAGAMIERERKRGANNVRRARRTTARAVLRSKMEALQADKRTGLNFLMHPLMVHQRMPYTKV